MDTCSTNLLPGGQETADRIRLDDQVAHLLRRAHQRASSVYLGLLAEHKLTPAQFFAMARLHEKGRLSQNRLGRLAAMDPATIQGVTRRLAERGYLERLPDPSDRRRMVLRLTLEGQAAIEAMLARAAQANETLLAPLDAEQRALFMALLRRLA